MSGHSKWSKVKHQKAVTDVVKARSFTKASHAITIAVKEGGGIADPEKNFRLRLAIEKAHDVNMPKENIDRIIEKAKGTDSTAITTSMYEGYGPGGVAMLVETASDNTNRTVAAVKNAFEHHGGTMVAQGAVSYQFERMGVCIVPLASSSYDALLDIAITAGASDVVVMDDCYEIYTNAAGTMSVRDYLIQQKILVESVSIIMKPKLTVVLDEMKKQALVELEELLESLEDVQKVYTNIE